MSRQLKINPNIVSQICERALKFPTTKHERRLLNGAADPVFAPLLNSRQLRKACGVAANVICTPIPQRLQTILTRGPITEARVTEVNANYFPNMDFSISIPFGKTVKAKKTSSGADVRADESKTTKDTGNKQSFGQRLLSSVYVKDEPIIVSFRANNDTVVSTVLKFGTVKPTNPEKIKRKSIKLDESNREKRARLGTIESAFGNQVPLFDGVKDMPLARESLRSNLGYW